MSRNLKRGASMIGAAIYSGYGKKAKTVVARKKKPYTKKKYQQKPKTEMKRIKKDITEVKRALKEGQTILKHRTRATASIISISDNVTHNSAYGFTYSDVQNALGQLQFWDFTVQDFVTQSFFVGALDQRSCDIKYVSSVVEFRNNYQAPCKVSVYKAFPKVDSNSDPVGDFNATVERQVINAVGQPVAPKFNPLIQLSDDQDLNANWRIEKYKDYKLDPGMCASVFHKVENITVNRTGSILLNQRRLKSFRWIFRVEGGPRGLAHTAVDATKVGYGPCGIDLSHILKMNVEYEGGKTAERIFLGLSKDVSDNPVYSSKPIADNIQFSIP